eukprot:4665822-Pleurochrysis_carterae.AAC.4
MFCAISGNAPTNPVVSKVSGHLFDRDTITHALKASGGKCPVTGESLSEDDLLSVKVNPTPKPRPIAAASIPGMLSLFQSEWDALVLELHTLKQQHDAVRQELAHALYQHDAACRVIARLIKERDDARTALAAVQPAPVARPEAPRADAPSEGMTPAILAKFTSTSKELSKGRKKRQPPEGQASEETVAKFVLLKSQPLHEAGRTCVEMHAQQPVAASGGGGGKVVLFECEGGGQTSFEGHTAQVNRVRLHPSKPLLVSCGADATSRVWRTDGALLHTLSGHAADVTDVSLHATGDFYVSASADKSWNLNDIERGTCVLAVKGADEGAQNTRRRRPMLSPNALAQCLRPERRGRARGKCLCARRGSHWNIRRVQQASVRVGAVVLRHTLTRLAQARARAYTRPPRAERRPPARARAYASAHALRCARAHGRAHSPSRLCA